MRNGSNPEAIGELLLWCAIALAGLLLLVLVTVFVRRRTLGAADEREDLLDLGKLQRLRDEGALSEGEYKALRTAALRALGAEKASR